MQKSIKGYWHPQGQSARHNATLVSDGEKYTLQIDDADDQQGNWCEISISNRVGNIPRRLTLEDHSVFETKDNDAIDHLLGASDHKDDALHFIHILETRWRWIASAILVTILFSFATIQWGIPWATKQLAYAMPASVNQQIASGTLEFLDQYVLSPSELSEIRQKQIREHFEGKLLQVKSGDFEYKLHFRKLKDLPNAFALPSGDIIVTDQLVELAGKQEEIDSVLLHEMGHVEQRHGLQQVIHTSIVTVGVALLIGDATAINEMIAALPAFLLESSYSRENEKEADEYAFEKMVALKIDPEHFATMFEKMTGETTDKHTHEHDNSGQKLEQYSEYLSTHPAPPKRMQRAREYSEKHFRH